MPSRRPCSLCPHHCRVEPGQWGRCGVRRYRENQWENPFLGRISSSGWDPIEKKPLYHFKPTEQIFSVGFWGCNMHCPYCQNWQISQRTSMESRVTTPEKLIEDLPRGSLLAFTYNEPLIHSDYILEAAHLARAKEISLVLVSNGMVSAGMAKKLFPLISACNIDLKCFREKTYRDILGGDLPAVKRTIELAMQHCHVEITSLLVPGIFDDLGELDELCRYLSGLDEQLVLHLSRYFPSFHYDAPPTPPSLMQAALIKAKEYLRWVYPGNIGLDSNSICPECGETLVERHGYSTRILFLTDQGECRNCKESWNFIL